MTIQWWHVTRQLGWHVSLVDTWLVNTWIWWHVSLVTREHSARGILPMASMVDRAQSSTKSHHGLKQSSALGLWKTCCWRPLLNMPAAGPGLAWPVRSGMVAAARLQTQQQEYYLFRVLAWSSWSSLRINVVNLSHQTDLSLVLI